MRPHYQDVTLGVEDRHWWYRGRRRVVGAALQRLPLCRGIRVLDAGCGGGGSLSQLAAVGDVVGLEPSAAGIAAGRARDVGRIVEGVVEAVPFPDASFDLVACLDVIEHTNDDVAALQELRRVTAPAGFLVLTAPAYSWLWSPHDVANEHRRRYTRRALLRVANRAGWEIGFATYFNALLLPLAATHRVLQRRRLGETAPAVSDFERTPGWLDGPLELPFRLEAAFIAAGGRIPAGLSVIAVLRRPTDTSVGSGAPATGWLGRTLGIRPSTRIGHLTARS